MSVTELYQTTQTIASHLVALNVFYTPPTHCRHSLKKNLGSSKRLLHCKSNYAVNTNVVIYLKLAAGYNDCYFHGMVLNYKKLGSCPNLYTLLTPATYLISLYRFLSTLLCNRSCKSHPPLDHFRTSLH